MPHRHHMRKDLPREQGSGNENLNQERLILGSLRINDKATTSELERNKVDLKS